MQVSATSIETVSGRFIDIADPRPEDFIPSDIAWALSHMPRFCGHTTHNLPYTVAQHSLRVAEIVKEVFNKNTNIRYDALLYFLLYFKNVPLDLSLRNKILNLIDVSIDCPNSLYLFALLHDTSEMLLADLPSPVKALPGLKEAYSRVENSVMAAVHERFGLTEAIKDHGDVLHAITHWADLYARTIEAYHLMPSRGRNWCTGYVQVSEHELQNFEEPKEQVEVYRNFLIKLAHFDK